MVAAVETYAKQTDPERSGAHPRRSSVLANSRGSDRIGSRLRRPDGRLDSRTPALWISNGTGRDGKDRRGAPKGPAQRIR